MRRSASGFKGHPAALLFAVLTAASAFPAGAADVPTVSAVEVVVDGRPADADLAALVTLAPGGSFSTLAVDRAVKGLFRTGLFSDVQVLSQGESDVRLTFMLVRRPSVRSISYRSGEKLSAKRIRESVYALRRDGSYSEEKRVRSENELRESLRKEGYLSSVVISSVRRDEGAAAVDVLFEIAPGPRFVLREIGFKGRPSLPEEELRKRIESRPGSPYNPAQLDADVLSLKAYYNGLGYPRAEVAVRGRVFHEQDNSVSLNFRIDPQERIQVEVRGAEVDPASLRAIWEERVFEDWAVSQAESAILDEVRGRGYVFASVRTTLSRTAEELRVIHEVKPGEKARIRDIVFEGNAHFSAAALKRALDVGPRMPFSGGIDGSSVFAMPGRIVRLYEAEGFPQTKADLQFRREDGEIRAHVEITEGPRRTIDRVTVHGAGLFPAEEILGQVLSAAGAPYYAPNIRRDVGRVESFYLNQGVRDTQVAASVTPAGENRFAVEFQIQEGRRVKVGRVVISGAVVTRRRLVEREIRLKPGDWASSEAVLQTKRGLEKLGVFSEVRVEEVPFDPDTVNLVINLREGERNLITLGAGLESKNEPFSLDLGRNVIGPRATAEFIRGNMFGRAAQLSLITQFSQRERRAVLSWEEPTFFGLSLQTLFDVFLEREARESYGFDRRGAALSGSKTLASGWMSLTTLRWDSTTLYFLNVAENEIDRQHFPFSTTSVAESFVLDRRDDSFNPERGSFASATVEWAFPLFHSESDFVKSFLKYQRFQPLFGRWNFSLTARAGLGMGRMPIHERFFAGGSSSFRGRPFDRLGPTDLSSDKPVGGKALLVFNLEMKFPLLNALPALAGAVFVDGGGVFSHRNDFSLKSFEYAAGLGLRYRTPLGPIRLDLAWNLGAPGAPSGPLAFITIGNVF